MIFIHKIDKKNIKYIISNFLKMIIFYMYLLLSIIIKCSTINNNEITLNNKSYDNELKSNLFPFAIIKIRKGFYELYNSIILFLK